MAVSAEQAAVRQSVPPAPAAGSVSGDGSADVPAKDAREAKETPDFPVAPPMPRWVWIAVPTLAIVLAVCGAVFFPGGPVPAFAGASLGLVVGLLLPSVGTDLAMRRIPNAITYTVGGLAVGYNAAASAAPAAVGVYGGIGLVDCLLGAVLCFSFMFTLFCITGGGAGDVKLMTALGGLTGFSLGLTIWLATMIIAAAGVLVWIVARWGRSSLFMGSALVKQAIDVKNRPDPDTPAEAGDFFRRKIPMAPFYALGTAAVGTAAVAEPAVPAWKTLLGLFG